MERTSFGSTIAFIALVLAYSLAAAFYLDLLADSTGMKDGSGSYSLDELWEFDRASTFLFFGGVIFTVVLFDIFKRIRRPVPIGVLLVVLPLAMFSVVYMVWRPLRMSGGF